MIYSMRLTMGWTMVSATPPSIIFVMPHAIPWLPARSGFRYAEGFSGMHGRIFLRA